MDQSVDEDHENQLEIKPWQHCSLFNLNLFNDERQQQQQQNTTKTINEKTTIDVCCCSSSSVPNVDETCAIKHLNPSCSFVVLQKNYTTQLEHVAEKLLANEKKSLIECSCCQIETNESKGQSLNRKILLGSTAILDSFLRNNLKSPLIPHSIPSSSSSSSSSTTTTSSAPVNVHIVSTNKQRRWHSERATRHPNVRANLPLTIAQRQVLERYKNYPIIRPATTTNRFYRRLHRPPITGKAGENTGTALAALTEQPLNNFSHLTKENPPRPLSSTLSSNSGVSTLNRRCFLSESISPTTNLTTKENEESDLDDNDDDDEQSESTNTSNSTSSDEENVDENDLVRTISNLHLTHSENLVECLICYERKRLQKRLCCDFTACSTCLTMYVEEQIKQGHIRIQCPNEKCHIYMHRDEIHKRCLSPELKQKFTRFFVETNRSINMKTCPRCSNIHEIDLEMCRSMRRAPTKVQCVECNLIWCFQCHSPWHDGIQCKEFRRGDRMLKKWAREVHYGQQNAQQCPSCKVYIQRTKGCDHIVCLRCKTEFCYKCGDRFRDIKFIGDHYSELSVLGCKYRFYPDNPWKRRLIRGSILGGKILAAPVLLCLAMVAGTLCAGIGLPAYCCFMVARQIKAKRRRRQRLAKLKEPVLMSYKTFNDMVPQLIPREPVNLDGVKAGFTSVRSNISSIPISQHPEIDIDPTHDAPIAVFDECEFPPSVNERNDFSSYSMRSSSPNFPRLIPRTITRRSPCNLHE